MFEESDLKNDNVTFNDGKLVKKNKKKFNNDGKQNILKNKENSLIKIGNLIIHEIIYNGLITTEK